MTIAINQKPIFTKSASINTGVTISAANTAKDGTGTVVTVFSAQRSVSSVTSTSTTATATCSLPHGFINGEQILINGAAEVGYNGIFTVTVTTPLAFTYTVSSGLSTPATGTITAEPINGYRVAKIVFQPLGTNVATVARAFLNNGQTAGTASNNIYIDDVTLAASTLSEVASMSGTEMPVDIVVPAFHKINVTLGTAVAAGYAVYIVVGSY